MRLSEPDSNCKMWRKITIASCRTRHGHTSWVRHWNRSPVATWLCKLSSPCTFQAVNQRLGELSASFPSASRELPPPPLFPRTASFDRNTDHVYRSSMFDDLAIDGGTARQHSACNHEQRYGLVNEAETGQRVGLSERCRFCEADGGRGARVDVVCNIVGNVGHRAMPACASTWARFLLLAPV